MCALLLYTNRYFNRSQEQRLDSRWLQSSIPARGNPAALSEQVCFGESTRTPSGQRSRVDDRRHQSATFLDLLGDTYDGDHRAV